ncbi:MAG TPA: exosome complex protein Rrp42 [Candidatus Nanoarchaeia archaeon]|nr:exosome complex protein Rrp42 [Candidatus Nanoarchaeia archaeon]
MSNSTKIFRDHLILLLEKGMREDGRGLLEYRQPVTIEYGVSKTSSEGSARVKIGMTEVIAGVKMGLGEPFSDTPDDGALMVGVELIPMSNPEFEAGPPQAEAIEISRVIDRGIRESQAIDLKKLCVTKGEKVWIIFIDIYPMNDAGNLFDACALAACAALKNARFPHLDERTFAIDYKKKTEKKLPLRDLPVGVTVLKIKNKLIIDPTIEEWDTLDARLSVFTLPDGKICALQKGGGNALKQEDIMEMIALATDKAQALRKVLEE